MYHTCDKQVKIDEQNTGKTQQNSALLNLNFGV